MSTPTASSSAPVWKLDDFRTFIRNRVSEWQKAYLHRDVNRSNEAVTALAQLRRGLGKPLTAVPELWSYTLEGLPGPPPRVDHPTRSELAAHAALTLYAWHQQSRATGMHQPRVGFGQALRSLIDPERQNGPSADSITARFGALGTAVDLDEVVTHARGLISQLRAHDIALDYGHFAADLLLFQTANHVDSVRLRWARDFYYRPNDNDRKNDDHQDDQEGQR